MDIIIGMLSEVNSVSVCARLVIAMFLGGIIGFEREHLKRAAGFRTFIIVCVGSALATLTGIYMYNLGMSNEVARIPAQVISGMGFLGAGTILVTRNTKVKGLTTAASLWTAACIGIAVGAGFYAGAIIGTLVISASLRFLKLVENNMGEKAKENQIYVEAVSGTVIRKIVKCSRELGITTYEFEMSGVEEDNTKIYAVVFYAKKKNAQISFDDYIEKIGEIEGVLNVEVI